jgi:hypothetical protein
MKNEFEYILKKEQVLFVLSSMPQTKRKRLYGFLLSAVAVILGAGFAISFLFYDKNTMSLFLAIICFGLGIGRVFVFENSLKKRANELADGIPIHVIETEEKLIVKKAGAADREILLDGSVTTEQAEGLTLYYNHDGTVLAIPSAEPAQASRDKGQTCQKSPSANKII